MTCKLYTLIHALDKTEARYFKLYSQRHVLGDKNKYHLIFDIYKQLDQPNEDFILKKLQRKGIVTEFFASDKHYLYDLILRCLNEYHHDRTSSMRIKESLQSIEVLFLKGLYTDCLKVIQRAEKLARLSEHFSLLVEILHWKKRCVGYAEGLLKANEVNNELAIYIEKLHDLQQLTNLYYRSYLLRFHEEKTPRATALEELQKLLEDPLLQDASRERSLPEKVYYYLIFSHYYYLLDAQAQELECLQTLVDAIHAAEWYRWENPLDYLAVYARLLWLKKYVSGSDFYEDVARLRQFAREVKHQQNIVQMRVFIYTYSNELEYLLIQHRFDQAVSLMAEIEERLAQTTLAVEPFYRIHFEYMFAAGLIAVGKYERALDVVNGILNTFQWNDRPLVFMKTELLNVLIHFELKNYEYTVNLCKTLNRRYKNEPLYSPLERKLVKTLAVIAERVPTLHVQISEPLQRLLLELPKTGIKASEQNYLEWMEAKVKKMTMMEWLNGGLKCEGRRHYKRRRPSYFNLSPSIYNLPNR